MKSFNPVCKFIGLLLPTFVLPFNHNFIFNLLIFAACIAVMIVEKLSFRKVIKGLVPVLLMALGLFFTGYFFSGSNDASVSTMSKVLSDTGTNLSNGLILSTRVLTFAGLGMLLIFTTSPIDLVLSAHQNLKVPVIFAYGLLSAWGIFPEIASEYRRTRLALRARGLKISPVSTLLIVNLVIKSINWSDSIAIAMASKGFTAEAPRTAYKTFHVHRKDILFIVAIQVVVLVLFVFFRV